MAETVEPGERTMPHNFGSGRDYRGGNAVYLAMNALERGYADPRWGGYRQIQEAGGHVRRGEKGTPIMYVEWRQQRTARDDTGNPSSMTRAARSSNGSSATGPSSSCTTSSNVEQTEGLKLRSLAEALPNGRATSVLRR